MEEKPKNHYENINLFIAKALAHGCESEETEQAIREECVNKYVEKQIELAKK